MSMLRVVVSALMLMLLGMAGSTRAADARHEAFDHGVWQKLLEAHVVVLRSGQLTAVDYAGFSADHDRLRQYLHTLSAVQPTRFDRWTTAEQLAFLINAYNAWTVQLVLSGYPGLESIKDLGSFFKSPWKKSFIPLLGATRSLDDIEHGLIRGSGRYRDPRIHFAVNCASIGCPALRAEAYVAERLDAQLEDQSRKFLSDRSRNRLDGQTLNVSAIFKWYREDFEQGWQGAQRLPDFLAHYAKALGLSSAQARQLQSGDLTIDYLDYDWGLNGVRR